MWERLGTSRYPHPWQVRSHTANAGERQLRWVNRSGQTVSLLGGPDQLESGDIVLSPDGRMAALSRLVNGNLDIWLMETARDVRQRLASDPAREYDPIWSPDGSRIVFGSTRKGAVDLYEKQLGGAETVLYASPESKNTYDWSPDGRWILFAIQNPKTARDLWVLPTTGESRPVVIAESPYEESNARFSPDGRWVAYQSNESGRFEIYIQPFRDPAPNPRSPPAAGRFPSGGMTEKSCSTWGWITVSWLSP